ncbi:MAG: hypothetical protein RI580_08705 [Halothece sp. Uz-M2-17]|nr:hypothetical protein [Halothece sp. Uz-M2-17]
MKNTELTSKKQEIYQKIDHLFDEPPTYKDLIQVLSQECQERGYPKEAIQEAFIDYFFHGRHYQQYRE